MYEYYEAISYVVNHTYLRRRWNFCSVANQQRSRLTPRGGELEILSRKIHHPFVLRRKSSVLALASVESFTVVLDAIRLDFGAASSAAGKRLRLWRSRETLSARAMNRC
jgi:hypothetical protein